MSMKVFKTIGKDGVYFFYLAKYLNEKKEERFQIYAEKYTYNGENESWRVGQNFSEDLALRIIEELINKA